MMFDINDIKETVLANWNWDNGFDKTIKEIFQYRLEENAEKFLASLEQGDEIMFFREHEAPMGKFMMAKVVNTEYVIKEKCSYSIFDALKDGLAIIYLNERFDINSFFVPKELGEIYNNMYIDIKDIKRK